MKFQTAGIRPLEDNPKEPNKFLGELKQWLLFFDVIGIPGLKDISKIVTNDHLLKKIAWLEEQKLVFPVFPDPVFDMDMTFENLDYPSFFEVIDLLLAQRQRGEKIGKYVLNDAIARFVSITLNMAQNQGSVDYVPIIKELQLLSNHKPFARMLSVLSSIKCRCPMNLPPGKKFWNSKAIRIIRAV